MSRPSGNSGALSADSVTIIAVIVDGKRTLLKGNGSVSGRRLATAKELDFESGGEKYHILHFTGEISYGVSEIFLRRRKIILKFLL